MIGVSKMLEFIEDWWGTARSEDQYLKSAISDWQAFEDIQKFLKEAEEKDAEIAEQTTEIQYLKDSCDLWFKTTEEMVGKPAATKIAELEAKLAKVTELVEYIPNEIEYNQPTEPSMNDTMTAMFQPFEQINQLDEMKKLLGLSE